MQNEKENALQAALEEIKAFKVPILKAVGSIRESQPMVCKERPGLSNYRYPSL
jgi:hypothetical protein